MATPLGRAAEGPELTGPSAFPRRWRACDVLASQDQDCTVLASAAHIVKSEDCVGNVEMEHRTHLGSGLGPPPSSDI